MRRVSTFPKTLKALIKFEHLTQRRLAEELDIKEYKMSDYCRGIQDPESQDLIKIANYFEISIESLLGRDNYLNHLFYQQRFSHIIFNDIPLHVIERLIQTQEVYIYKTYKYEEVIDIDIIHKKIVLKDKSLNFKDYGKVWMG